MIVGGSEILCHHDSAELMKTQQSTNVTVAAYA
jgi:peptide/nickel transport system ATP-binding protein